METLRTLVDLVSPNGESQSDTVVEIVSLGIPEMLIEIDAIAATS